MLFGKQLEIVTALLRNAGGRGHKPHSPSLTVFLPARILKGRFCVRATAVLHTIAVASSGAWKNRGTQLFWTFARLRGGLSVRGVGGIWWFFVKPNNYYVYILRRANGIPFYVGKGQRDRIHFHAWAARQHWPGFLYDTIRKIWASGEDYKREKVATGLTHEQAAELECLKIAEYGRRNDGGSLCNITFGGDGAPGYKHTEAGLKKMSDKWKTRKPASEETRRKISLASRGRKHSLETRQKLSRSISGANHWNYGKKISEEHAEKLHAAQRKKVLVNGVMYESVTEAARAYGIQTSSATYRVTRGKNRGGKYGKWEFA